jgi:hypothetical protein
VIIRHHLAKGYNDIKLTNVTFATEHEEHGDETRIVGFKVKGDYGGDNPRSAKHKYEIIFETGEETDVLFAKANKLQPRFNNPTELPSIAQVTDDEKVEDEDGSDEDDEN